MIIWFFEVPVMLFVLLGLVLIVCAKMIAMQAAKVLTIGLYAAAGVQWIGVAMLAIAFILFWVTVVMQHYDEQKTNKCERVMKMLGLRGAILAAVGFLANVALHTDSMPMWITL